ncbi:MAG: ATP-binding protein [Lachnospiraceae bacterium]|nr:ATP-binding protein [Lachnospiraceae bacterium]
MKMDFEWALIKTNHKILFMTIAINIALTAGYIADVLKGRTQLYTIIILFSLIIINLTVSTFTYLRNRASQKFKYLALFGFLAVYCFAVFDSRNTFTYVFVFPVTILFVLYYDVKFTRNIGIAIIIINAMKIILQLYRGYTDMNYVTEYTVQVAFVSLVCWGLYVITQLAADINNEKLEIVSKAAKNAEEANRAKSNFLAAMSHEIRTPMNVVLGIAQIQLQSESLPPDQVAAHEKIYNSGTHLLGIINDILDMSKIETGKMEISREEYDIPSLISDAVQASIVRIGKKPIKYILEIDENLPSRVIGDELRLRQILNNLLSNAVKYTEEGYIKLTISRYRRADGSISLLFRIEDTGQGIKEADKERMFTEYSRFNQEANRATEGTGLGLNISKSLIELMGGSIRVESEYGKGSVFYFEVLQKQVDCPVIGKELAEQLESFSFMTRHADTVKISRDPMPYGKVLVVDDVDTNLYVAEGLMSPYELKIETAQSGYQALEKIARGASYDIIFMDHMMPEMDGMETTKRLRESGYKGTIVALTANALVGNAELFKQNGFDEFISKPINIQRLNSILTRFVRDKYPEEAIKYQAVTESVSTTSAAPSDKMLAIFRKDAEKAIIVLRNTLIEQNIPLFITTVHAMKAALANIGKQSESSKALALEEAGRRNEIEFMMLNAPGFIDDLENFTKELAFNDGNETGNGQGVEINEDTAYLKEKLLIIKDACENYDDVAAYAALDEIELKAWNGGTKAKLDEIRDKIYFETDFEQAADIADSLCL